MSAGAAAAAAAAVNAMKASGAIIQVEPLVFQDLLNKQHEPLVVTATTGIFTTKFQYMMNYKGLAFYTKSSTMLILPQNTELVHAKSLWVPG